MECESFLQRKPSHGIRIVLAFYNFTIAIWLQTKSVQDCIVGRVKGSLCGVGRCSHTCCRGSQLTPACKSPRRCRGQDLHPRVFGRLRMCVNSIHSNILLLWFRPLIEGVTRLHLFWCSLKCPQLSDGCPPVLFHFHHLLHLSVIADILLIFEKSA